MTKPKLSVVVTSRNDDHGGNLIQRMQLFVTGLMEQARRHQLRSELIIVEWNPPSDRPRLAQALRWPGEAGPCTVRFITVPPEIHRRFNHSDRLPLFQMIAKNVGIRRALGRSILATNIDILFSDEMIRFFASRQLKNSRMYRVDRYDGPSDIPEEASIKEQLAYCRENIIRINRREGTLTLEEHLAAQSLIQRRSLRKRLKRWMRGKHRNKMLHTNAAGDFTLMDRKHWFAVRGYAEFEMYSFRIDALLCYAAHHNGTREAVLRDPMRIYHIEHSAGSGWTPGEGAELLKERLRQTGIPWVKREQSDTWRQKMINERRPIIFADEKWGLANEELPETTIG